MTASEYRAEMTVRFAIWDQHHRRHHPAHHGLNQSRKPGPPHPDTPSTNHRTNKLTTPSSALEELRVLRRPQGWSQDEAYNEVWSASRTSAVRSGSSQ